MQKPHVRIENRILFTKNFAYIKNLEVNVKFVADRDCDLFFVRKANEEACVTTTKEKSLVEWHRRFGYLNKANINKMILHQLASDMQRIDSMTPSIAMRARPKKS